MSASCIVGPCDSPREPGSEYCSRHGERHPTRTRAKPVSACPRCGGTNLVPRRKTATKVVFGVTSLIGRPKHAECASCGYLVKRPN